ncbi:hypothetical protein VNO77_27240 [Canavalia gladiata]|uniref:Uncharacterized protein n=1 Tax=Canavalia gladiata TaxID=3824 RepID=A0AAN9Q6X8_CANGL
MNSHGKRKWVTEFDARAVKFINPSQQQRSCTSDRLSSSPQHGESRFVWMRDAGLRSMVDIVKRSGSQAKTSTHRFCIQSSNHSNTSVPPIDLDHNLYSLRGYASKPSAASSNHSLAINRNVL